MAARLLLIEDDNSITRFVEMALEELPAHAPAAPAIQLHAVRSLADARAALAIGGWHLVISDLMLPDGSAETLLAEGVAQAAGAPPWVVFSAGVTEDRHLVLASHGVARTLRKPVTLLQLLGTVAELLGKEVAAASAPPAAPPAADPVHSHFGGDRVLFETFRAGCIERFANDLSEGNAAMAAGDTAALRRVAHGLKAVLALIGEPALAARASALEAEAAAGGPLAGGWAELAEGLARLRA